MKVSSYKWIYDRNRIIIAKISTSGYTYYGKLYYFDMTDKNMTEIRDNYYNKDIKISLTGSSDSVTGIDMSAQTDLTFLKVKRQREHQDMGIKHHGFYQLASGHSNQKYWKDRMP